MRTALVTIEGTSPLIQSKRHFVEKPPGVTDEEHDLNTVREKVHYNKDGMCVLSQQALTKCIQESSAHLALKVKGNQPYKRHFRAGIAIDHSPSIGVHRDDVEVVRILCNPQGNDKGGKQIVRNFPQISKWSATFKIHVLDDVIGNTILEKHLDAAGKFIGMGSFRPQNGGCNGRFKVTKITWENNSSM